MARANFSHVNRRPLVSRSSHQAPPPLPPPGFPPTPPPRGPPERERRYFFLSSWAVVFGRHNPAADFGRLCRKRHTAAPGRVILALEIRNAMAVCATWCFAGPYTRTVVIAKLSDASPLCKNKV